MAKHRELACGPDEQDLRRAVETAVRVLEGHGIVAHPTFAVYGLGGAAVRSVDAAILALKGQRADRPLLRLVLDAAAVQELFPSARWPSTADCLAEQFWPGGLTLVLDDGTAGGLAVRAEAHRVVRQLLVRWGRALSSTSLNLTGQPPAASVAGAREALEVIPAADREILFLNAGTLRGPPASTVLSLRGEEIRLLREGTISVRALEQCLGRQVAR